MIRKRGNCFLSSIGLLGLSLCTSIACAQETPVYRWQRSLEIPAGDQTRLMKLSLDSQFFEATRLGWPDVRVRNDLDQSLAFVIQAAKDSKSRTVRHFWPAKTPQAKFDAATGLRMEFALRDTDPVPDGIRIDTPLKDFEHQVRVESSEDGTTWIPNGSTSLIFDYSRFVDARNVLFSFDRTSHRHFRVTIQDVTAEQETLLLELNRRLRGSNEVDRVETTMINRRPFRVDGIDFYRDESTIEAGHSQTTIYPSLSTSVSEDPQTQHTTVKIANQRQPISEVKLLTNAENFSRAVTIEADIEDVNGVHVWQTVGRGTISRFAIGSIQREQLTIPIRETQTSQFRLTIENADSPPLAVSGVELKGSLYELVVLVAPHQNLILEYGSLTAKQGRYDDAALRAALAQGQIAVPMTASAPAENENASTRPDRGWRPWNDTRLLFAGIIALTILLGWGLFRAGRQIESTPSE